jgi:hypothetical protein
MLDTVGANGTAVPEEKKADEIEARATAAFNRAYSRWLAARAAEGDWPMKDEEMNKRVDEEEEAERAFPATPAAKAFQVWNKLEAVEAIVSKDLREGRARYSTILTAFGSLKADIVNLDLCDG